MQKRFLVAALFAMLCLTALAQQTIQERLGYSKDAKLLILHADDLGVAHAEDSASIYALENHYVSSGSIMVPCPWLSEIANYAATHPNADLGIHLTLTSEWKYYKWGPVSAKDKTSSLVNSRGYFYDDVDSLGKMAKLS